MEGTTAKPGASKMKMFIVDDKEENLYMLEALLKGSGYEVASAMNGVEALEKLKEDSFDMIISDILMPQMDGYQLCRKCKKDDTLKKIPFVFYTATYTEKKEEEFGLSLGAVHEGRCRIAHDAKQVLLSGIRGPRLCAIQKG